MHSYRYQHFFCSLRRQIAAIDRLTNMGMRFWDYGNAFLLECQRAGADVSSLSTGQRFKYPSYMEDIMGFGSSS